MKIVLPLALMLLAACTPRISGLMPIEPAPDNSRIDTVRPLLKWEPMPEGDDPRITELVYDVQILNDSGSVLVERNGLTVCEFQVEHPLEYAHAYLWTVRARFRWDGRRRQTEWSRLSDSSERLAVLTIPLPRYLPFRTPTKPSSQ
jgi:hypothetical protein